MAVLYDSDLYLSDTRSRRLVFGGAQTFAQDRLLASPCESEFMTIDHYDCQVGLCCFTQPPWMIFAL